MIANSWTGGNKLKASKGFRESANSIRCDGDAKESALNDSDKDAESSNSRGSYQNAYKSDYKFKPRIKQRDDFRMGRGANSDRRGGGSSRGRGSGHRKNDRDLEPAYFPRSKFHESLGKNKSCGNLVNVSNSGKSSDADVKIKLAEYGGGLINLPEDCRISKLLRRMLREDDEKYHEKYLSMVNSLKEALMSPENSRYIQKNREMISNYLLELLYRAPGSEAKLQTAEALGALAFSLDKDYPEFLEWLLPKFKAEKNDDVRKLMMKSLHVVVQLDGEQLRLKSYASETIHCIQQCLEHTDLADCLVIIIDSLMLVMDLYPDVFSKYFRDVIDILLGWHADWKQPAPVTWLVSATLQRMSPHWCRNMAFSQHMLRDFLDDIEHNGSGWQVASIAPDGSRIVGEEEAEDEEGGSGEAVMRLTSCIGLFSTVVRTLGQHLSPTVSSCVSWSFLTDCLSTLLSCMMRNLKNHLDQQLIITGNECAWLLLSLLQSKTCPAHETLYELLDLQLSHFDELIDIALASLMKLIAKVIKELGANLPLKLVETLLKPHSPLLQLRFNPSSMVHTEIVAVYHSLLNLKNIPLLKEVYRNVLGDLEVAYRVLVGELEPLHAGDNPHAETKYNNNDAHFVVLVHFKALADIANASNSIIGMWVLQPSIVDLLAVRLMPKKLSKLPPDLQYALLYMLYSHCSKHNHFISSSGLLSAVKGRPSVSDIFGTALGFDVSHNSPMSGHLSVILGLLANIIVEETSFECKQLVLGWTCELLRAAKAYMATLSATSELQQLADALLSNGGVASSCQPTIAQLACACLEQLVAPQMNLEGTRLISSDRLMAILEVCMLQISSTDEVVSARFCQLMMRLPWTFVISGMQVALTKHKSPCWKRTAAERSHLTRGTNGEMQTQQFKQFMAFLLQGHNQSSDLQWLREVFSVCWSVCEPSSDVSVFAHASTPMLLSWATWETAQLCISCKLRTPLGKPLDTFMAFEGAIKGLARETTSTAHKAVTESSLDESGGCSPTYNLRRVRLLIELVEQLEKTMYNAADGTATALVAPTKPVRTFFHTNKSTCGEWLARIRLAVVVVSLHCGLAASAVRNGHCLLQDLLDSGNTQGPELETAVLYVAWGLSRLHEAEAVQGLYAWCRDTLKCKFAFLKPIVEHAASRYETAIDQYKMVLNNEAFDSPAKSSAAVSDDVERKTSLNNIAHILRPLVADQLTECYLALQDWSGLQKWKEMEAEYILNQNGNASKRFKHVTETSARALQAFDEGDKMAADQLLNWSCPVVEGEEGQPPSWNCYQLLGETSNTLMNVAVKMAANADNTAFDDNYRKVLLDCRSAAKACLVESVRNIPSEIASEATLLQFAANALLPSCASSGQSAVNPLLPSCGQSTANALLPSGAGSHLAASALLPSGAETAGGVANFEAVLPNQTGGNKRRQLDSKMQAQVYWWCGALQTIHQGSQPCDELALQLAKTARKEGNLNLASRQLLKQLKDVVGLTDVGVEEKNGVNHLAKSVISGLTDNSAIVWTNHKAAVLYEVAKLNYSMGQRETALQVCTTVALQLSKACAHEQNGDLRERCARMLLTLAKWQQAASDDVTTMTSLETLLEWCDSGVDASLVDVLNCDLSPNTVVGAADSLVGRLLRQSVLHCPGGGKAWASLANWAYRWGRRVLERGAEMGAAEKAAVEQLLGWQGEQGAVERQKVYDILLQNRPSADEEDIEAENMHTSEQVEWQLQNLSRDLTADQLSGLVEVWRRSHARVYTYYELAAQAYFKYLQLLATDQQQTQNGSGAITATLRLLRLIVKHARELQGALEVGLAHTPTAPWVSIIPQLFSRLSHPQPYVRSRVSELLCRLAADAPHLIIFPAVVGSDAGAATIRDMPQTKLFSSCLPVTVEGGEMEVPAVVRGEGEEEEEEDDEEEEEEEEEVESNNGEDNQATVLENCFLAMVDTLAKQVPEAISQVRILVHELRRITLLWDELWLGTLTQHHNYMARRIVQLEGEIARVDNNQHLTLADKDAIVAEKYRLILKPLLFVLEQLHAITSVTPETPHEQWFQDKFGESIDEALTQLRTPLDPRRPADAWATLKALQCKLQSRAAKRAAYALRMREVSPALAQLANTRIAMPGVESSITIAGLSNQIAVLPTKTKPKKLVFHGSDGLLYTYLFKGLEDLHLDERIMQFLCIANTMLRTSASASSTYQARHYSVIPLGPRSGLISWVDNVTPLFTLYKRWQQREAAISQTNVMRPSELFYQKLIPRLTECGITNFENRKEWPLPVLKQVLMELMQETPTFLLSKELWCHSVNAGSWWESTKLYSTSLAVMSIIGYIIGLGDRHLDNVLIDLASGEVVHIDYNVCFEKGKTLRVPEKVPFRLTPNLRAALGVTGVEGIFRLSCEHVLKVMKKGMETLLTLLEAFVYDPLIDWTPGNETGYTGAVYGGGRAIALETKQSRKQLEKEVTFSMFAVRIAEMKYEWMEYRDSILCELPALMELLERWLVEQAGVKQVEDSLQERHHQMALLKDAEAHAQHHSLYSLPTRYAAFVTSSEAASKARTGLEEKVAECQAALAQFQMASACITGPQLSQWMSEVAARPSKESYSCVFDLIKEFLANAGQREMVQQCAQCETDLSDLCAQQSQLTTACLELLGQYGAVARLYPVSYLAKHRSTLYLGWGRRLLEEMSLQRCEQVLAEAKLSLSSPPALDSPSCQQVLSYSLGLLRALTEARVQLKKWQSATVATPAAGETRLADAEAAARKVTLKNALAAELVIVSALCGFNKRFLMMEAAASGAGDSLVDLTSREGDWFLDDMYLITGSVSKLLSLLPDPTDARLKLALECAAMAHNQYKGLQELNMNFTNIILPEALQIIQREDESAVELIAKFKQVVNSSPLPLCDLLSQLQLHLECVIMGIKSSNEHCRQIVADLRAGYEPLVTSSCGSDSDQLSPGLMLLMGFNGLFENLAIGNQTLITALTRLQTPAVWRTVDQVREAKSLAGTIFDAEPRSVLEDIFMVRRLQTMHELFDLCVECAAGFRGGNQVASEPHDDERLNRTIRRFTADYVSHQLLGVFSHTLALTLCLMLEKIGLDVTGEVEQRDIGLESRVPLDELCRKAMKRHSNTSACSQSAIAQAQCAVNAVEQAWRGLDRSMRLTQKRQACEQLVHRLQLQLAAHYWLHDDVIQAAAPPLAAPISRCGVMMEVRKVSVALLALQPQLVEVREQQATLVHSAQQRLKWAAGANPAVSEVLSAFHACVTASDERVVAEQQLASVVGGLCSTVLMHEALRTRTSEALTNDANFIQLVEECEKSCYLGMNLNVELSAVEEGLVRLLPPPPTGHIDWAWINKAEQIISESVSSLMQLMGVHKAGRGLALEAVKQKAAVVHRLNAHTRIRALLKTMVKFEDTGMVGLNDYFVRYKAYCERLYALTKDLLASEELTADRVHSAINQIAAIIEETLSGGIYEELLNFSVNGVGGAGAGVGGGGNGGDANTAKQTKRPPLLRQDSVCLSPCKQPIRDPQTGKAVQERNKYALSVWRRVRLKLEGRDRDPGRKYSVQEQVDWTINEATSLENLALLYEGWTPWV
ncbi:serine/threonine-protein kinase SMG1-like [Nilaparvata lugens]|uniref:serine/threonine-protein kinase SMG1-like n=1 Tax=Nilaparvata lugens TaxID=108931 RepID=UPI00193C9130|nr:serine/threonine-protein kinase SMG1-like [Nilaparvata lugens]